MFIQNIKVSANLKREEIFELGKKKSGFDFSKDNLYDMNLVSGLLIFGVWPGSFLALIVGEFVYRCVNM